ncbi:uncharacterized protein M421DRAFT_381048 [Didymella exigua CBS 183.55]|uniref:Uncharacterized protein n=1 Tax=Didymella exigua CBS 183.55 TaxID=1150837 RepID=A0A6A5RXF3_9PLEO|nr:uncharacterized protein M421DRAFT_381048 [Didymella exigua CBS 183.55]KAF1929937.1 hypothetical protein M421DRAFT_381048 [Didymella exigua CBS 183.55]
MRVCGVGCQALPAACCLLAAICGLGNAVVCRAVARCGLGNAVVCRAVARCGTGNAVVCRVVARGGTGTAPKREAGGCHTRTARRGASKAGGCAEASRGAARGWRGIKDLCWRRSDANPTATLWPGHRDHQVRAHDDETGVFCGEGEQAQGFSASATARETGVGRCGVTRSARRMQRNGASTANRGSMPATA